MTDTQTQTAVRYDRDSDGIVTLTLDDPTASANTMNELYQRSMAAAVQRLYDELAADEQSVTGVVVASAKKTFFAGGNLKLMSQAGPADAPAKGLVDEVVADRDALVPAAKKWILEHRDDADAARNPWDREGYRMPGGTPQSPKLAAFLPAFPALLRQQTKGA